MAELSKDEIIADAILDAATPAPAEESSFPEVTKKKPTARKAPAKKAATITAKKALPVDDIMPAPVLPAPAPVMAPAAKQAVTPKKTASSPSNELVKKAWRRINTWGLGISGKVVLLLIVIGIFSDLLRRF